MLCMQILQIDITCHNYELNGVLYLCSHYVSVWAVSDSRWLLSQLFWVHGFEWSDGEGIQKLNKKEVHDSSSGLGLVFADVVL